MTITADGYVSWAERDDRTPRDKTYPYNRHKRYLVVHSMEGWLGGETVPPRFLSTEKNADGNYVPAAQASVTFCLLRDGRLIQCFPLDASPWTSGSRGANMDGVPIETEGVAGTPLNPAQVATFVRLVRELEPWFGFALRRDSNLGTIIEHNELSATACPSGRYAPAYAALRGAQEGLSVEDKARLDRLERIVAGYGVEIDTPAGPKLLGGEEALAYADARENQWSAFLGIRQARKDIGALAAAVAEYAGEQGVSAGDVVDELARRLQAGK